MTLTSAQDVANGGLKINDSFNPDKPCNGGLMNLYVFDNYVTRGYGMWFLHGYNFLLGLTFTATNISLKGNPTNTAADQVTINQDTGDVMIGTNVKRFDLNVLAPNGKQASTEVIIK